MAELFLAIQKSVAGFEKLIVIKRILPSMNQDKAFIEKVQSSWKQFYEEYPSAQGILTISRVGFNSDKSEAVVYIQNVASLMLASGKLFFLTKKNGSWEVQTEKMIWFS